MNAFIIVIFCIIIMLILLITRKMVLDDIQRMEEYQEKLDNIQFNQSVLQNYIKSIDEKRLKQIEMEENEEPEKKFERITKKKRKPEYVEPEVNEDKCIRFSIDSGNNPRRSKHGRIKSPCTNCIYCTQRNINEQCVRYGVCIDPENLLSDCCEERGMVTNINNTRSIMINDRFRNSSIVIHISKDHCNNCIRININ